MTLRKSIYILLAGMFCLTSCSLNELPKFNDKDAFVAFDATSVMVNEDGESAQIGVTLASIAGLSGTVDFEFDAAASTAVLGEHFTIRNSSNSLSFGVGSATQYIEVAIIDNEEFTGDLNAVFQLASSTVDLGANTTCRLVIVDLDHPLSDILDKPYKGSAIDAWGSMGNFSIVLEKDADDIAKVWLRGIDPAFATLSIYGVVNEDMTEIAVPSGQEIGSGDVKLHFFGDPLADTDTLPEGTIITIRITNDGKTLEIDNAFGSYTEAGGGFYSAWLGPFIFNQ